MFWMSFIDDGSFASIAVRSGAPAAFHHEGTKDTKEERDGGGHSHQ
jgi:hypothetical protein